MLTESITGLSSSRLGQIDPILCALALALDEYYNLICLSHTLISIFVIKVLCYSKIHQYLFTPYFKMNDKVLVEKAKTD